MGHQRSQQVPVAGAESAPQGRAISVGRDSTAGGGPKCQRHSVGIARPRGVPQRAHGGCVRGGRKVDHLPRDG